MRKYLSILLILCYLFSTTELSQTLKLPFLIEHFQELRTEGHSMSFLQFIKTHYFEKTSQDNDRECDSKLPFKKHDICNAGFVLLQDTPREFRLNLEQMIVAEIQNQDFFYREPKETSPFFTIFTPPKIG